jgi:hypothetical protein
VLYQLSYSREETGVADAALFTINRAKNARTLSSPCRRLLISATTKASSGPAMEARGIEPLTS